MNLQKTIQEKLKGLDPDFDNTSPRKIKLVRHADNRTKGVKGKSQNLFINGKIFPTNIRSLLSLYLYRNDLFLKYQSEQALKIYRGIKYLVSFIGDKGTTARFIGVYKIMGYSSSPYNPKEVMFNMHPLNAFSHLEGKIIIEWGKATQSWHQYYVNQKSIICIDEKISRTTKLPNPVSLTDAMFSYPQLKQIVLHPEWVERLKKVNCIYAILDLKNGKLYVGSTYNTSGILGRWESYAKTGHGDDKDLNALIANDPLYAQDNFQWTILEILPLDISKSDAINREKIWKIKLGTIVHGYNNN